MTLFIALIYLGGIALLFSLIGKYAKILNEKYYLEEFKSQGDRDKLSFYQHVVAIVNPKHYFNESKLKEAYICFLEYTCLYVGIAILALLFLKEIRFGTFG